MARLESPSNHRAYCHSRRAPLVIPGLTGNLVAALKSERGTKGLGGPQEGDWSALGPFWKGPKADPPIPHAPQRHIRPRSLFKFSRPTSVVEPGWRGSRFSSSLVPPPWRNPDGVVVAFQGLSPHRRGGTRIVEEIAQRLSISQGAVNQRAMNAGWPFIKHTLAILEHIEYGKYVE